MDGDIGGRLPDDLRDWVDERAEREGVEPVTVLTRAVNTYRLAIADSGASLDELDSTADRLEAVEGRVDGLEDSLDEKVDDVRMRIVQVKREADEKAPRDHDHPEFREDLDRVSADVGDVRDQLSEMQSRVDAGFDNYEEILTYLDETTAELDDYLRVVAQSVLDLRSRAADIEAAELEREALSDLLRVANDTGEEKATCDNCGETIHLGLLSEPRCPACRSVFDELSPSHGFFGSATLSTGKPLALEAAAPDNDDVETLLDEATTSRDDSDTGQNPDTESATAAESPIATESDSAKEREPPRETTPNRDTDDD
ncbi:hypothetical protein [Haloferax sp. YSSS75]|uniref:hypothetical protein n=1 Tax=Haloferax sp. YSSS75 TaxID=3388564 RepID=UPI00398CFCC9